MADSENVITVTPLDDAERTLGTAVRYGGSLIDTPRGTVRCTDAPGFQTLIVQHEDPEMSRVAVLAYAPGTDGEPGAAMIAQLDATQARGIAASLCKLAAMIDPRKPN